MGRLCRRPARADGPSRHPRILLSWATASAAALPESCCSGRPTVSSPLCFARPSGTGRKIPDVMYRHSTDNWLPDFAAPAGPMSHGHDRQVFSQPVARCSPISSTACRASSSRTAARRSSSCRTTRRRIRCRPRSTSPRWRRTPRSRSSRGASPRSSRQRTIRPGAQLPQDRMCRCAPQRSTAIRHPRAARVRATESMARSATRE